jgi:molybdate transport system regulatory protein
LDTGRITKTDASSAAYAIAARTSSDAWRHWRVEAQRQVWVVFDDRVKFGDGRAEGPERVEVLGSRKQAVAGMRMLYRAAWGYLRELERAAGFRFLAGDPGRGRTRLTVEGRRFLARYRRFHQGLDT